MIEAGAALQLALGDLVSWSAALANDRRNAGLLRAMAPKRRGDAKAAPPAPLPQPSPARQAS